jgi:hypothetical protein
MKNEIPKDIPVSEIAKVILKVKSVEIITPIIKTIVKPKT